MMAPGAPLLGDSIIEGDIIYQNPLSQPTDVADWVMEGDDVVSFPMGRMR
tara:strand:+ start:353 stop:502 length:150 start_codon:yes stop_codon:yes gene_type:complete